MEERVILSLSTYDRLQMELVKLQDEVKQLRKSLDSIRVFNLEESYTGRKNLVLTDYALEQFGDLVDSNPTLEFSKLEKTVAWGIAKPKQDGDPDA